MSENESFNWLTKTITLHKTFERKLKMLMLKKRFPKSIVSFRSPVDIVSDSKSLPSFFRWSLKKKTTPNGKEACQDGQVQVCLLYLKI